MDKKELIKIHINARLDLYKRGLKRGDSTTTLLKILKEVGELQGIYNKKVIEENNNNEKNEYTDEEIDNMSDEEIAKIYLDSVKNA